jgi:2-C-methyl-D-erythritol 2,4-cyclodiphosphate synthase
MTFRTGFGFDVHRLVEGRPLILGGVAVPSERGCLGHSDADVLLHAICDALLGAAALGDIGKHFPDTDPKYKGISSLKLLQVTRDHVANAGWSIVNVDSTLVLQNPKISPYVDSMRKAIAECLGISTDAVSIKATTSEGLGYTGSGEGVVAYAVAMLKTT